MADGAGAVVMTPELKAAFDEFKSAVLEGQKTNDQRLDALTSKGGAVDVLIEEKSKRLDDAIATLKDDVNKTIAEIKRSGRGGDEDELEAKHDQLYYAEAKALDTYVRKGKNAGEREVRGLATKVTELGLELKDLATVELEDGGIAVRPEWEAEMIEVVEEISDMRKICRVLESGTADKKILVDKGGAAAAWANELAERIKTATAQLAARTFSANELYAFNFITETMKEDAAFDIMAWLMENATDAMARAEGAAFINGDGAGKPKGILAQDIVANASWAWGKLGFIATGEAGGFAPSVPGSQVGPSASTNGADVLIDLVYSLPKRYRANCDWVMNRLSVSKVRKLKDADGNYLFRDALTASGLIEILLGYPINEAEDMPDFGESSYPIAFGDFYRGYYIVDRTGMSVKRDDITEPQYDKVYIRRRTTGDVGDYQAIKLLKDA